MGGHFATFEYENILRDVPGIDSVVRHEGVGLQAEVQPAGRTIVWTVTGGRFRAQVGDGIVWTLPVEAGLYQAELLVDHGEEGFAFDTLTVEVHGV